MRFFPRACNKNATQPTNTRARCIGPPAFDRESESSGTRRKQHVCVFYIWRALLSSRSNTLEALYPPSLLSFIYLYSKACARACRHPSRSKKSDNNTHTAKKKRREREKCATHVCRLAHCLERRRESTRIAPTLNDETLRHTLACASSLVMFVKRPSARRGPGIVSVDRNVRSKCRCSCVLQFTS